MKRLLILDCEATAGGQTEGCAPIEIAWITSDSNETKVFQMRPESPVLPCSTVIHGLTQEDVDQFDPIDQVLPEVYEQFRNDITENTFVTAYNTDFDFNLIHSAFDRYLEKKFQPINQFDTLRLARKVIPLNLVGNHRLDTVFYYLHPNKLEYLMKLRGMTHDASHDVEITEQVISSLWKLAEDGLGEKLGLAELSEFANGPMLLDVWPFGKHYGEPIEDVIKKDSSYVRWFLEQSWADERPDLVYTIEEKSR